ncbi:hypothetical protein BHE74_00053555 [Ensete ventricosum]|nr:hypothetical protein BHE74_00053555 [Ensete ventricosum]
MAYDAHKGRQPPVGAAAHKGDTYGQKRRPRGWQSPACTAGCGQPAGATVARKHSRLQRDARKGSRLQDARKGLPPAGAAASGQGQPSPEQGQRRLRRRKGGKRGYGILWRKG